MLVTDPQNDFLSEQGVTWQLVGDSVRENKTVENIERLFQAATSNQYVGLVMQRVGANRGRIGLADDVKLEDNQRAGDDGGEDHHADANVDMRDRPRRHNSTERLDQQQHGGPRNERYLPKTGSSTSA